MDRDLWSWGERNSWRTQEEAGFAPFLGYWLLQKGSFGCHTHTLGNSTGLPENSSIGPNIEQEQVRIARQQRFQSNPPIPFSPTGLLTCKSTSIFGVQMRISGLIEDNHTSRTADRRVPIGSDVAPLTHAADVAETSRAAVHRRLHRQRARIRPHCTTTILPPLFFTSDISGFKDGVASPSLANPYRG